MIRDLASLAAVTGGVLHGANAAFRPRRERFALHRSPAISSSRCVASTTTRTTSSPDVVARGAAGALVNRLVSVHVAQVVVPGRARAP